MIGDIQQVVPRSFGKDRRARWRRWSLGLALCVGPGNTAWAAHAAQGAQRPDPSAQDTSATGEAEGPLWFASRQSIELHELVEVCSVAFDLPLTYDPAALQGEVRIQSGPGLSNEGLWALTNRLLLARDLACVQAAGEDVLSIVALDEAPRLARIEPGALSKTHAGYVRVFETLWRAAPEDVASAIDGVLSLGQVQALPGARGILIAGLKPQVAEALEIARLLDSPSPTTVTSLATENLTPSDLVALLERIATARSGKDLDPLLGTVLANPNADEVVIVAPEADALRWGALVRLFDKREPSETRHYVPRRFGLTETAELIGDVVRPASAGGAASAVLRIVEDELTGTLIVTATASDHRRIEELFDRLESAEAGQRTTLRSFPVHQRDVEELLGLLEDLIGAAGVAAVDETPPSEAPPRAGGTGGRPAQLANGSEVTLSMDPGTNRILAVGAPRVLDELARLIEALDVRLPQVLVEVLVVSLTSSETRDLAVELVKLGSSDGTLLRLASLFDSGAPDPAGASLPALGASGLGAVVLHPGSFAGALRALETVNDGRSLTMPRLLVNNNETATLNSLVQEPFTAINSSTTIATTSFGGTLDAGTTVSVRPQITDGDMLILDYAISLSTFVGDSTDPSLPPPRQESRLESIATVPDGFAVVVGGLEVETQAEAASQVPLLGRIPLLGNLFKSQSDTETASRFFVFFRCNVLRGTGFDELKHLSRPAMQVAGLADGHPRVRPIVIR